MASTRQSQKPLLAFISRLHFYIGFFVGPFILVAALSGMLFVLTPQIERVLYADQLRTTLQGQAQPLAQQVAAARASISGDARIVAIRPAPDAGSTTRVMFNHPGLKSSESRAIFVDPVTLAVQGDLVVYGTSGTLPFRTWLDYLHRNLLLGEWGRYYSELAASWLWLAALGGLTLWFASGRRSASPNRADVASRSARLQLRRWHGLIGLTIAAGLVFFSATGLTWSKWAGGRIDDVRQTMGWVTPALVTALNRQADPAAASHGHEGHEAVAHAHVPGMMMPTDDGQFDRVLQAARMAGIDSNHVEIRPPVDSSQAWSLRETDRSWPTQVDAIALDPVTMAVISRSDFASFPLVAKLIRWGIDMHMGILFGWVNQLVMAAIAGALCLMVVLGYGMWWRRRPAPASTLVNAWLAMSLTSRIITTAIAVVLGWFLPLMGMSLLLFLGIDVLRSVMATRGAREEGSSAK